MSQMLPPDMAALASQGGDPAAAMGGGGMPPDMMAMLSGAGAPPPGDPNAGGPPPPNSIADGTHGGGEDALVLALDALQDAIDAEADQEDVQVMLQCQTKLQAVLAKNQAEADKAMGGGASPGAMRKMAGGL